MSDSAGLKSQVFHETALTSDTSHKSQGNLPFWPTHYKLGGGSYDPTSFSNMLEWHRTQENFTYNFSFMIKDMT